MCEALARGEELPFDPKNATIYYVGPTPAKPGHVIGSAGPTTSGRMDAYAPTMMSVGARGMIGKGARLPEVVEAMKKYSGVYFGAIGGAGALLAKCIKKAEMIAYEDLGRRSASQALCRRDAVSCRDRQRGKQPLQRRKSGVFTEKREIKDVKVSS